MTKRIRISITSLGLLALLCACQDMHVPDSAFYNRGGPESLLDVSSEVVNLSVAGPTEVKDLSAWIQQDLPTRAELYCDDSDIRCHEAHQVLELNHVPTMVVPSGDNTVALVYERILARDCKQRYIDDSHNNANAYYPSFGCATAANIVQEVSDKQEFVNPALMDVPPAESAVQAYQRALTPRKPPEPNAGGIGKSIISIQGNGGGS